ncbi:MAG: hypothetical protein VX087_00370 [Pseudomonadota bacterium]|nr:hypothetical protein [Pseudomonadota bacterium]
MSEIAENKIAELKKIFSKLINIKLDVLKLPIKSLKGFEPSQIAVIINTLLDGLLPQIESVSTNLKDKKILKDIKLKKYIGKIGQREGYPDYIHESGFRVELKGLFVDNKDLELKRPPTKREPSARIKDNIKMENINPKKDLLLVIAIKLIKEKDLCIPTIVDIELLSMDECIKFRDTRLQETGGKWINGVPKIISKKGIKKRKLGQKIEITDYEHDTNFGKLKRIPLQKLQNFIKKYYED